MYLFWLWHINKFSRNAKEKMTTTHPLKYLTQIWAQGYRWNFQILILFRKQEET